MVKATWNGQTIAESENTVVVEGNHYFPPADVRMSLLKPSAKTTVCGWKGTASYYTILAGGQENADAAWTYPETKPEADNIKGRIAFWKGVEVG